MYGWSTVNFVKYSTIFLILISNKCWYQGWNSQNTYLNSKQGRPWSDCFWRSSLIWVCLVCLSIWQTTSVQSIRASTVNLDLDQMIFRNYFLPKDMFWVLVRKIPMRKLSSFVKSHLSQKKIKTIITKKKKDTCYFIINPANMTKCLFKCPSDFSLPLCDVFV